MPTVERLLEQLQQAPDTVQFDDVIAAIDARYRYTPTLFTNGIGEHKLVNEAGKNEGSCKIFAFGRLHGLSAADTLACFGQFYRDVRANLHGSDHANIRTFMHYGWDGVCFDGDALTRS